MWNEERVPQCQVDHSRWLIDLPQTGSALFFEWQADVADYQSHQRHSIDLIWSTWTIDEKNTIIFGEVKSLKCQMWPDTDTDRERSFSIKLSDYESDIGCNMLRWISMRWCCCRRFRRWMCVRRGWGPTACFCLLSVASFFISVVCFTYAFRQRLFETFIQCSEEESVNYIRDYVRPRCIHVFSSPYSW